MEKPLVSIIVPIYKVEEYLDRCVESLIKQTLKDIEIILVDDGSPDRCPEMCDEYAKKNSHIVVIHKENGGLSDARNVGMLSAQGQYILFVDSDDFIISNACEVLYQNAVNDNLDIVIANAVKIENQVQSVMAHNEKSQDKIMTGIDFLKEQLEKQSMLMAVWLNLYRKDFLLNNKLMFKKGIYHEDEQWTPRVFLIAQKVKYTDFAFYNYVIREDSITKKKDRTKNGIDLLTTCYELEKIYENIQDSELKKLLNDYLTVLYLHAINYGNLYDNKYKSIYSKKFLIGKPLTFKNKIKSLLFILSKHIYRKINRASKSLLK